jgi:hypothetical protein
MPGLTLGIGETNPKRGAVQYDARRIDGVPFVIPAGAGVTTAAVGSIVSLQELGAKQYIVLGAAPLTIGSSDCDVIGIGFLEAANQTDDRIDQSIGVFSDGDIVAMVSSIDVVASVPAIAAPAAPVVGSGNYITPAGKLTVTGTAGNVAFPGVAFYGTPGVQNTGQLKTGNVFARLTSLVVPAPVGA